MKRIKSLNGYAIYQAGPRDVGKYGVDADAFYVYFSSDIRDFGISNSEPEFEGLDTLEEAESCCTGNYAKAREIVESRTTAASAEEIAEVEAQLDAGTIDEDGEAIDEIGSETQQQQGERKGELTMTKTEEQAIEAEILNATTDRHDAGIYDKLAQILEAYMITIDGDVLADPSDLQMADAQARAFVDKLSGSLKIEADDAMNSVECVAMEYGFSLGINLALMAVRNDGDLLRILQSAAAEEKTA